MLEGIKKLKETRDEFVENGDKEQKEQCDEGDMLLIALFMEQSIHLFEEIANYQNELENRIRRLEENESYYLANGEKIKE